MNKRILDENISRLWSSIIIDELVKLGVHHFFISPGMRNTPLIEVLHHHPVQLYEGIDERSLAFKALGYAQVKNEIVILLCTSGSALSNFYPAILEASIKKIPLVILSADRPQEMCLAHANQTLNQHQFYGQFTPHFLNLGNPTERSHPTALRRLLCHFHQQILHSKAPGHLNIPLYEPLDGKEASIDQAFVVEAKKSFEKGRPSCLYLDKIDDVMTQALSVPSTLVVVGELAPHFDKTNLKNFLSQLKNPLIVDITSSLKTNFPHSILPFDYKATREYVEKNITQIIHIGGKVTSNSYYRFLEKNPLPVFQISTSQDLEDPSFVVERKYLVDPHSFFTESSLTINGPGYMHPKINLEESPFFSVAKKILNVLPEKAICFLGNSLTIRIFDLLSSFKEKSLSIYTQRGTSGLEGHLSVPMGLSLSSQSPVVAVLGDVAFLYDLNALHYAQDRNIHVIFIVVNNHGGGIFNILPTKNSKLSQDFVQTPHEHSFEKISSQFKLTYKCFKDLTRFDSELLEAYNQKGSYLFEVLTTNEADKKVYEQITQ